MGKRKKAQSTKKKSSHNNDDCDTANRSTNVRGSSDYAGAKTKGKGNRGKRLGMENKREDDDHKLRRSIESSDGSKTVVEMSPDGNCLFRSLGDQLYYDYGEQSHFCVRSEICDYLEAFPDDNVVIHCVQGKDR